MKNDEKKLTSHLLARMVAILDVAEEVAERIFTEVVDMQGKEELKTATLIGDLIKLIQLLEKQYAFLRAVEKEQLAQAELPKPDEDVIRNYLNDKHQKRSRSEKVLEKGKQKYV